MIKILILKPIAFLLLTCCIASANVHAQYDSLLHLPTAERYRMVYRFYLNDVLNVDSGKLFNYINGVRAAADKANDKDLARETDMMKAYYYYQRQRKRPYQAEAAFTVVRKDLEESPDPYTEARLQDLVASWNWEVTQNYEIAFEYWEKALDSYRRLPEPLLDIRLVLMKLADAHYTFGDYPKAIAAWKDAFSIINQPPYMYLLLQGNNTVGLCYQQLKDWDSSDMYFKRAYHVADSANSDDWRAIISGNLGNNLFQRGRYNEAIPLLREDVEASVKRRDWPCASGSQTILADIMLRQNNIAQAAKEIENARQYVYLSDQYRRFKPLYPLMSKLYAAQGNAKLATLYLDSSIYVNDSLDRKFSALQMLKAQQKNDLEKHNAQVAKIENQKKLELIERNVWIGFTVLLFIGALYFYSTQRKKHLHKQQLLNLQLKEKEAELTQATAQLADFARNISEKNDLLESLQQQFGENSNNEVILKLQQSTILTDEEWEKFRTVFEKVHGGYLTRLKQKLPELSPAETRFMALAKLQLSNKEMAASLGVSKQAIRTTWYRLRKKLNLPEEGTLEELVEKV